jgi:N-methylhydantoinase A
MAAVQVARECGFDRVITFDMGGTTAKSALSAGGRLATVPLYWVESYHRGWPVQCHSIDIIEVGAGGGSIAWIDEVGALHVGPTSAGSDPGPACYGRGGTQPTITDAHVHLGHIPATCLGTEISLDRTRATASIEQLAGRLKIGPDELAEGILQIADNHMAAMLRTLTARRGYDPRDFALVAFGGSGPLHATALARELKIRHVLVPARAGVFSAFGMLLSDLRLDGAAVSTEMLQPQSLGRMNALWRQLRAQLDAELSRVGEPGAAIRYLRSFDGRYRGQDHVINVSVPDAVQTSDELRTHFDDAYRQLYGHHDCASDVQITVVRLSAFKEVEKPRRAEFQEARGGGSAGPAGSHMLRSQLEPSRRISGPSIILEEGATIMLKGGDSAVVLPSGDLLVEVGS